MFLWLLTHSVILDSLQPHGVYPAILHYPWNFPDKNTGMGCHFLLQANFLIQGSKPCLLCILLWQADSLPLVPTPRPPPQEAARKGYVPIKLHL